MLAVNPITKTTRHSIPDCHKQRRKGTSSQHPAAVRLLKYTQDIQGRRPCPPATKEGKNVPPADHGVKRMVYFPNKITDMVDILIL